MQNKIIIIAKFYSLLLYRKGNKPKKNCTTQLNYPKVRKDAQDKKIISITTSNTKREVFSQALHVNDFLLRNLLLVEF